MSHYAVLVVDENPEELLQPFHEFGCTGIDDEYVKDINITEKILERYNKDTTSYMENIETGELKLSFDSMFFRDPINREEKQKMGSGFGCGDGLIWDSRDWKDGRGYRTKIHYTQKVGKKLNYRIVVG